MKKRKKNLPGRIDKITKEAEMNSLVSGVQSMTVVESDVIKTAVE